jgi:hypothetical protein
MYSGLKFGVFLSITLGDIEKLKQRLFYLKFFWPP